MNRILLRGFAVWLLIALAETVHGTVRTIFLKPVVGDLPSRQLGLITGSMMILLIAFLTIRWIGATAIRQQLLVGLVWLIPMLCFEIGVGRAFGMSWERILADYLPWQGGYMVLGMTILFLSPLITARLRDRQS
jgi:hypothetical protein